MTRSSDNILQKLQQLRSQDAPTHGGKLLSYVYDPGMQELDELAQRAMALALPVNGLDPTMFPSVPAMERDLISFARKLFGGGIGRASRKIFGQITSGGTESCMLAVKSARDLWRTAQGTGTPRILAPQTVHAAFHKAAHYFGLRLDLVPVSPDGVVRAQDLIERMDTDVALVVVSAPSYPTGQLDPVAEVADAARRRGIACHVDACFGGFALPFWGESLPAWDFRVPGVTSLSADLHKFGYAPKGTSVLLHRSRKRARAQFFATKRWPGYPVVNPTLLGSRSATSLAAAWAITNRLELSGYRELVGRAEQATRILINAAGHVRGLRIMGRPYGPVLSLTSDEQIPEKERVDPHHLADHLTDSGFLLQQQPGLTQSNGVRIPHSVHLTITPVTLTQVDAFVTALGRSADAVRGRPRANPRLERAALRAIGLFRPGATLSPERAWALLSIMGAGGSSGSLPKRMAPLMRLIEELPDSVVETLLIEVIARMSEPRG